jgi:hypothetical protein
VVALKEEAEKCARAAALVAQADEESKARDFSGAQQTVAAALALDPEVCRPLRPPPQFVLTPVRAAGNACVSLRKN